MLDWKHEIRQRLAGLKLEPTREAAIVEELAQYLGDCYAESLASGVTPAEAERQTRSELSGSELLARELRRAQRRGALEPIEFGTNQPEDKYDRSFMARPALRRANVVEATRIYFHSRAHACARHRREYDHL